MVVLIDGRVQQRQICVFKAQFVDSLSKGLQVGDCWDEDLLTKLCMQVVHAFGAQWMIYGAWDMSSYKPLHLYED